MNKNNKGFTLIELLVVIAIIGILSSVVLASLNSARNKGADAATKSTLDNMRAQAALYYDSNSNYTAFCTNSGIVGSAVTSAASSSGATATNFTLATGGTVTTTVTCHSDSVGWAIEAPLKAGGMFCVDATTTASTAGSTLAASDVTCN